MDGMVHDSDCSSKESEHSHFFFCCFFLVYVGWDVLWRWGFGRVQVSCSMPEFLTNPIYWYRHILQVSGKPWRQGYIGPWSCLLPARKDLQFVSHCPNVSRQSSHRVRAGSSYNAESREYEQLMEKAHLAKQRSIAVWTVREPQLWNRAKKEPFPF